MANKSQELSFKVWHVVISASLCSIWLGRNEFVFNCIKCQKENFVHLIYVRAFEWPKATGLISQEYKTYGMLTRMVHSFSTTRTNAKPCRIIYFLNMILYVLLMVFYSLDMSKEFMHVFVVGLRIN